MNSPLITTQLMNMVCIRKDQKQVLVLDKVKKHGWEGLTFPGGKVGVGESLEQSVRREAFEETGLQLGHVELIGLVSWVFKERPTFRQVGLLYLCDDFTGHLQASREGPVLWMDMDEFLAKENKSDSMDDILKIYQGEYQEVIFYYEDNQRIDVKFFGRSQQ